MVGPGMEVVMGEEVGVPSAAVDQAQYAESAVSSEVHRLLHLTQHSITRCRHYIIISSMASRRGHLEGNHPILVSKKHDTTPQDAASTSVSTQESQCPSWLPALLLLHLLVIAHVVGRNERDSAHENDRLKVDVVLMDAYLSPPSQTLPDTSKPNAKA
jgi:hypothetical protein